jgi:hypothetical protein
VQKGRILKDPTLKITLLLLKKVILSQLRSFLSILYALNVVVRFVAIFVESLIKTKVAENPPKIARVENTTNLKKSV